MARLLEANWRMLAACRSADPDLFFPFSSTGKSPEQDGAAKAVCVCCLVRRQCQAFRAANRAGTRHLGRPDHRRAQPAVPRQDRDSPGREHHVRSPRRSQ